MMIFRFLGIIVSTLVPLSAAFAQPVNWVPLATRELHSSGPIAIDLRRTKQRFTAIRIEASQPGVVVRLSLKFANGRTFVQRDLALSDEQHSAVIPMPSSCSSVEESFGVVHSNRKDTIGLRSKALVTHACFVDQITVYGQVLSPLVARIALSAKEEIRSIPVSPEDCHYEPITGTGKARSETTSFTLARRAWEGEAAKISQTHDYTPWGTIAVCGRTIAGKQRVYVCSIRGKPCQYETPCTDRLGGCSGLRTYSNMRLAEGSGKRPTEPGKISNLEKCIRARTCTPVRLFFGTDRETASGLSDTREYFGPGRANKLLLGSAVVTVPRSNRSRGEIPLPSWWERALGHAPQAGDPEKHFTIQSAYDYGEYREEDLARPPPTPSLRKLSSNGGGVWGFLHDVGMQVEAAGDYKDHAFVFVHGFNVTFDNALFRAAQIAYDLGYDEVDGVHVPFGTAFLYSWPSGGEIKDYAYDAESAHFAAEYLRKFLKLILAQAHFKYVHLIAHSMGNLALLEALDGLNLERSRPFISEIVLAAPDVDAKEFEKIAAAISPLARGMTLYASSHDVAMQISRKMRREHPRAGDVPAKGPVIVERVDTLDVSNLSTGFLSTQHSTYADSGELLTDIQKLFETGEHHPSVRDAHYVQRTSKGHYYWRYLRNQGAP